MKVSDLLLQVFTKEDLLQLLKIRPESNLYKSLVIIIILNLEHLFDISIKT